MAEEKRVNWGSQIEFILTLVGFAVGLGNVWRFPYLCYKNGGGAFLVPYFISLFVMGIPLFYLELAFGQFASLGPLKIWIINPAMKGLGYAMVIVSALIAIYYNVIIAVAIYYFFASMTSELPWSLCNIDWASCNCRDSTMNKTDPDPWNFSRPECAGRTDYNVSDAKSPSDEYFNRKVLQLTSGLGETGGMSWQLSLCLLACWTVVFLVLTKGVKSLGKVVYVMATFPYILLTAMLIRGVTLPNASTGIHFYLTPNVSKLAEAEVWSDAAVQIFFSLSACSGGLIAMASYNGFNNNVLRDAFLVPIINCGTSFYAGFVIFSTLGFMAGKNGVEVKDVVAKGPGLAFVAYPEALSQMPVAPLWAILFFLMMMMLGFSSSFSIVETVLTGLLDEFPILRRSKKNTILFRLAACVSGFLLGLPMVTGCGFYLLDLVDNACSGFPLLFVGLFETIAIIFIYGYTKFRKDIEMMLGYSSVIKTFTSISFYFFAPMWCLVTPLCLLAVIIFRGIQYQTLHFESPTVYPEWADALWWLVTLFPILSIFVWFLVYLCYKGCCNVLVQANSPDESWGPGLEENRTGRYATKNSDQTLNVIPSLTDGKVNYGYTNGEVEAIVTTEKTSRHPPISAYTPETQDDNKL
uniref:Transporter n=1 Tax=Sinonovacula rivularis TaxID=489091 RepID=A0AA50AFB3_9BIVA|nr:ORPHAN1 [Sinonovacula rivularis]